MGIVRFALKSTIAGSVTYYTIQGGLWSNAEDTAELYSKLFATVGPYVRDVIPKDVAKALPDLSSMAGCSRGLWNIGVTKSIKFVSEIPDRISSGIDSLASSPALKDSVSSVKGLLDAPPQSGKTQ